MNRIMGLQIQNPYDSHVHWEATGAFLNELKLDHLQTATDIFKVPKQTRQDWILGCHWDDTKWEIRPSLQVLDEWAPDHFVLLQRVDRHAAWVNTRVLKKAGLWRSHKEQPVEGGRVELDSQGWPTGILLDKAMDLIWSHIPAVPKSETRQNLLSGIQVFNQAGFTHIRDLTCSRQQFEASLELYQSGQLSLAVEQYFDVRGDSAFDTTLLEAKKARHETPPLIRIQGIKMYYDGALGSEGALISRPYYGCGTNFGFRLYEPEVLGEMIRKIWEAGFRAAIHVIGDEAAHQVIQTAGSLLSKGFQGHLELEHAEMLRDETIKSMIGLNVTCHMQPCHWLSDKKWTNEKLGPMTRYLFRWNDLQKNEVPFFFGSDSPIEPASIFRNIEALQDAALNKMPLPEGELHSFFEHPDPSWVPGCSCELGMSKVKWTKFKNQFVHQS